MAAMNTEPATTATTAPSNTVHAPVERAETADTFTTASAGPVNSTDFAGYAPAMQGKTAASTVAPTTAATSTEQPHTHVDTAQPVVPAASTTAAAPPRIDTAQSVEPTAANTSVEPGPGSALSARSTGLAAALETSGHNITKVDAQHLKQEIKNEKQTRNLLEKEEKAEAREITAAITQAKACVKDVDRSRKILDSSRKSLTNRQAKEAKAKQAFLKAEEALKEATARTARVKEEVQVAEKQHTSAVAAKQASDARVEQLRSHKGQRDVEREQKQAQIINKMSDAERTLAASGHQSKFRCF